MVFLIKRCEGKIKLFKLVIIKIKLLLCMVVYDNFYMEKL